MDSQITDVPQIRKRLVQNNTGGYIGVVRLDHQGQEQGVNINPGGTIWLSDAEMVLTARAPQDPANNPFEEREYIVRDPESGQRRAIMMRPLTLADEDPRMLTATDRYVPGVTDEQTASRIGERAAKEGTDFPGNTAAIAAREAEVLASARQSPVAVPAGTVPAAPAAEPAVEESWTEPPPAPGQVISGNLRGEDPGPEVVGARPLVGDPTDAQPGDAVNEALGTAGKLPSQPAPSVPGVVAEEHAQRVDPGVGEETGAARPPSAPAPEGEYAAAEEIGSPDAPEADDNAGLIGA